MSSSTALAAIIGPTLLALASSEAINLDVWKRPDPQIVALNGTLLLAAGLAILHQHWVWVADWRVLLTACGLLLVCAGLYRMFLPAAPQAKPGRGTYSALVVMGLVGAVLSWEGWVS